MDEQPLTGGSVNSVVRVGSTVHRSSGPWTPAVHALLEYLEEVGFAEAPRVLGMDDQNREVLTYIEGTAALRWNGWPDFMLAGDGIDQLGDLLRRYHDAVRGFRPPPNAQWRIRIAPHEYELVRHGDPSPPNTIWRDDKVVGLVDWDFAQPGKAISDLAYLAWYAVPLAGDDRAQTCGFKDGVDRAGRLRALCSAYGQHDPHEVVAEAVRIIVLERVQMAELSQQGVQPWVDFVATGNLEAFSNEAAWIRENVKLLLG
jgi:hypothetical protein